MKKNIFTFLLLAFSLIIKAQPPKGNAKHGSLYGLKFNAEKPLSASEIPSILKDKDTVEITVKAKALDACSSKGCWLTFYINDSTNAFVKMNDYSFFVPLAIIGKNIVLKGKSFIKTTSVSELKHYAEDAKKSQKEIDEIINDKKEIRFIATGILVVK